MALTLEYFYHQTQHKYRLQLLIQNARLDHRISWVHLVEDSNNSSFLRGNELIITTGLETAGNDQLLDHILHLSQKTYRNGARSTGFRFFPCLGKFTLQI